MSYLVLFGWRILSGTTLKEAQVLFLRYLMFRLWLKSAANPQKERGQTLLFIHIGKKPYKSLILHMYDLLRNQLVWSLTMTHLPSIRRQIRVKNPPGVSASRWSSQLPSSIAASGPREVSSSTSNCNIPIAARSG